MKGYKALNMDMSSAYGDMVYEIGKKYTITGQLKLNENGYHFCKCLEDIELYYKIAKSRIFEIETDGKIIDRNIKFCAESITLMWELSKEEIHQYFEDNQERILKENWLCRKALADQGLCLDKLVYDEDLDVRRAVARQRYGLHVLIHDENPWVRAMVAEQGYGLETLINDKNWCVRKEVAAQGYGLDILINDTELYVRTMAAIKIKEKHPIISLFHFMIPIMAKLESNKYNSKASSNSK